MKKRMTLQRKLVMDTLTCLADHPTADEIYDAIIPAFPTISKGTVYRNLNILAEEGCILRIPVPNAADRFDHTLQEHYHLRCSVCGTFQDIDVPYQTQIDKEIEKITGYAMEHHSIIFQGICPICQNQSSI